MTLWDQVGDGEREAIVLRIVGALEGSGVPHHLRAGLVRYFSDGILPGSFLQAILCNDLRQAVHRAAGGAFQAVAPIVLFLTEYAPEGSWGSPAAVLAWTVTPERLEIG